MDYFKDKTLFLWDFDGCFADTEYIHFTAYNQVFTSHGHVLDEAQYYPSFTHLGQGTQREIDTHKLTHLSAEDIMDRKRIVYSTLLKEHPAPLFPEMLPILKKLKNQGGTVVIASNSSLDDIYAILKHTDALPYVDNIVGKTADVRSKPYPDIFLKAMAIYQTPAHKTLVFEDSQRGLEAARDAHCQAIWIKTVFNANLTTDAPHIARLTHEEINSLLNKNDP